jgi:hypothetical protein
MIEQSVKHVCSVRLCASSALDGEVITNLSHTDAATASIGPAQCIWFYDCPDDSQYFSIPLLLNSLQKVLDSYRELAGKLEHVPFHPNGAPHQRFGRLRIRYGSASDPGIAVIIARCEQNLANIVPSYTERGKIWDFTSMNYGPFANLQTKFALYDGYTIEDLPTTVVSNTVLPLSI